ncbi:MULTISPECIES: hypothetical protein [Aeromonas]|uniref:hypothetical protein n=1 Tax=Aeromonas TaxID=642 RepID=UPI0032EE192B
MYLQPHGQFELQQRERVLLCRPIGAFNLAGAMAYEAEFSRRIASLSQAPWGIVEIATEFEAAGPDVLARFRSQFGWCAANGCAFLAVVMAGGFKQYLAERVFAGLPFQGVHFCESEEEAMNWVREQLAALDGRLRVEEPVS